MGEVSIRTSELASRVQLRNAYSARSEGQRGKDGGRDQVSKFRLNKNHTGDRKEGATKEIPSDKSGCQATILRTARKNARPLPGGGETNKKKTKKRRVKYLHVGTEKKKNYFMCGILGEGGGDKRGGSTKIVLQTNPGLVCGI